jgi:hypothetical protein
MAGLDASEKLLLGIEFQVIQLANFSLTQLRISSTPDTNIKLMPKVTFLN